MKKAEIQRRDEERVGEGESDKEGDINEEGNDDGEGTEEVKHEGESDIRKT